MVDSSSTQQTVLNFYGLRTFTNVSVCKGFQRNIHQRKNRIEKVFSSTKGELKNTFNHQYNLNQGIRKYKPTSVMTVML